MQIPETRYARSGDLSIAYSVSGSPPPDILYVSNWTSNVEAFWDWAPFARFIRRLRSFGRVILFDLPGNGLSDPVAVDNVPTIEQWMDHVRVVMDAVGSERAILVAEGAAGGLALPFAATHPDRTLGLILIGSFARLAADDDYAHGFPLDTLPQGLEWFLDRWGTGMQLQLTAPSVANDPYEVEAMARAERHSASPGIARAFFTMISQIDVRDVLPTVHVPTLVIHKEGDLWIRAAHGRYLAEHIEDARYLEIPGEDHYVFYGDMQTALGEIRSFVQSVPERDERDRVLATMLFTDIVDSTARASSLGDRRWREQLDKHDAIVREEIARFRGREVKTLGDGFLATFDGTARAVRCGLAIKSALRAIPMHVRVGVHAGEIERRGEDVGGIAVHVAARIASLAGAGELLVSQTVKDLTIGSGLIFEDHDVHTLKGVPGEWRLYAVAG
ncbi:MAG TPA: adenylate/guanylate cyclase domain-containing protein [Actinomycetota bacterium]|nr:adenylate/guanylate cyclase domain-containing protein [Actinomycetota bacterium]